MNYVKTTRTTQDAIITKDEVRDILIEYNIGKKPLAKLLGWGETTIIRYIEGDIPTIEYSKKLKQIKEDPNFYYDMLIKNQDKLTTVAFKKSRRAVLSIMMKSKIKLIAQYIINKSNGEITARRIQAILFYSQVISLGIYGLKLFEEECRESYNNMPYISLYENMKKSGLKVIDFNTDYLAAEEREIIDHVYDAFEWFGPKAIRTLIELEMKDYTDKTVIQKNKAISMETLRSEYHIIFEKYNIQSSKDFLRYIQLRLQEAMVQ